VGEGRLDAVFAMLGGLLGAAVFAHFHERLIPLLYDPTNIGQITLVDWFGNRGLALVIMLITLGVIIYSIGKLWQNGNQVS
jgi:hypothetical protein